jgi:hypothetical protein
MFKGMENHFGVGRRSKNVSRFLQNGPNLPEVINLAVVDGLQRSRAAFHGTPGVGHRLGTGFQVDDSQPPHGEPDVSLKPGAAFVGPAVAETIRHCVQKRPIDTAAGPGDFSDYSAHGVFIPFFEKCPIPHSCHKEINSE